MLPKINFKNYKIKSRRWCDLDGDFLSEKDIISPNVHLCIDISGYVKLTSRKRKYFHLRYSVVNNRLYYLPYDDRRKLIKLKIKKRRSNSFINKILSIKPKFYIGINDFLKFTMPLIRRVYPSMIGQNIVSVQPMVRPIAPRPKII